MLANNITEKEIENYHLAKVQGELVLPYSWNSHQYALEMLKGVTDKLKRSELRNKLFERFSIGTNAHQTIGEK
jgi:hypothetical protein